METAPIWLLIVMAVFIGTIVLVSAAVFFALRLFERPRRSEEMAAIRNEVAALREEVVRLRQMIHENDDTARGKPIEAIRPKLP
jgi:hypothetical protein